ncbi:hypothetical protein [Faecalibacter macacae]|uniref:Uncharacterized protein n=1 Tax=Faecalibacter macacae TaxID=1859289 RepID=A0A3L9MHC8_9FLAO|nr:hypothetical protein [Faecalibacter macacae]RLZ12232.1 hypothetical protein EAH69_01550 [Faecalibacter macacae]
MKNILQKIFLFFTVFLFSWGYGQNNICPNYYNNKQVNITNYTNITFTNSSNISNPQLFINGNSNDYANFTAPASPLGTTTNATYTINNLNIPSNSKYNIRVSETNRTALDETKYTITLFNGTTQRETYIFDNPDLQNNIAVLSFHSAYPITSIRINVSAFNITTTLGNSDIRLHNLFINEACTQQIIESNCNQPISLTKNHYDVSVSSTSSIATNLNNIIDDDNTNYASWGILLAGSSTFEIKANQTSFPAGTYVGFVLTDYAAASIGTSYTIETYNSNNILVSSATLDVPLQALLTQNRNIGIVSNGEFNRVLIKINALGAATFSLYNAYIIKPCATSPELECNINTPITQSNYAAVINYADGRTGTSGLTLGNITNLNNIVNGDHTDFGTMSLGASVGASAQVSVKDLQRNYEAGSFAGFEISNSNLLNVNLLNGTTIITYLDGVMQEESTSGSLLVNLSILGGTGRAEVGFTTTKPFDEVQYKQTNLVGVDIFGSTQIYNMVVRKSCNGPEPACNIETPITSPTYPATIQAVRTGTSGALNLSSVTNAANVVNSDTSDFATMSITGLLASASLSVSTGNQQFAGGNFVGFDVANTNLLDVDLLGGTVIKTYMNGVLVEQSNSNTLLLDVNILSGSPRAVVGFITTLPFNEVQYEMSTLLSANPFGETRIYNMIIKKFCEGDELPCNVSTLISKTSQPITIKDTNVTGVSLGGINNVNNILDGDENTYAEINITASVLSTATISLEKLLTPYPANTYVSFDVEINNLAQISVLPKFSIVLLNNGVEVGRTSGGNFLLGVTVGTSVRKTLGYLAPAAFNEIKFIYEQPIGVSLGNVKLFDLKLIKACQNPIDCSDSDVINTLERPVVINEFRTGPEGIGCVGCSVQNAENLISPNTTDYTTLNMAVGIGGSAGVSVLDLTNIYPKGTYVGFTIEDVPYLLQADVFEGFFVRTYLNGVEQEVVNDADILDLSIIFSIGTGTKNYGFRAKRPFNEVKFEVFSLVSTFNTIKVYNLRIDASSPTANDGNINCINGVCVKPGSTVNGGDPTKIGISNSENTRSTWPDDIKNGFLALDSKSKGMIISRVTNSNLITEPKLGMLVYDISSKCVKLYNGVSWNCIKQSCND